MSHSPKIVIYDLLFHWFPTFPPLTHGPKITRIRKIYTSTCKSSISEGNLSSSWRNNLGNILLDTIDESTV